MQATLSLIEENNYAILISLKTMTIFNNASADISLKMVIVLSEMRIA